MKKKYIPAEIEVFMFFEEQVLAASGADDIVVSETEHDNAYMGFEDFF